MFTHHRFDSRKRLGRNRSPIRRHIGRRHPDEVALKHANLSAEAYRGVDKRRNIGGLIYRPDLSDSERAVYLNPSTGKFQVAIRGTARFGDVLTDVGLAVGGLKHSKRFDREAKALDRLGSENIETLTGHSLGGSLAGKLGAQRGIRTTTFNEGRGLADLLSSDNDQNVRRIRTRGDLVSLAGALG